jgi:hypothetical protein
MDKDEIKGALGKISDLRTQYNLLYEEFVSERDRMEEVLQGILEDTQKEFGFIPPIDILLSSSLEYYNVYCLTYKGGTFFKVEGEWVKFLSVPSTRGGAHRHAADLDARLGEGFLSAFNKFVQVLEERSTIPVQYSEYTWAKASEIERPKFIDDLKTIHEYCTILASGEKWYEGWDIADPWAVLLTAEGQVYIYYAVNGHGFGYDTVIKPGQPTSAFLAFLETPEEYLDEVLLEELKGNSK